MRDEVEQFIKRVRELQQQEQGGPRPPRPTPVPPHHQESLDAEIVDAEAVESGRQRGPSPLGAQGMQYLAPHNAVNSEDMLSDTIELADEMMEAHIHQAFGHQLGTLQKEDADALADAQAAVQPSDIAQILADPQSFRRAIIVSEILNRPTHRWK